MSESNGATAAAGHHGRCECGGVDFVVDGPLADVLNCHCHRCRRFTGHHMAAARASQADLRFASDATLRWWSPDGTVQYGFCGVCGASLFWRRALDAPNVSIGVGTLDQPTGLRTVAEWWVSEHGDYHTPEPGVVRHDLDG
jgi:hypothetical protein